MSTKKPGRVHRFLSIGGSSSDEKSPNCARVLETPHAPRPRADSRPPGTAIGSMFRGGPTERKSACVPQYIGAPRLSLCEDEINSANSEILIPDECSLVGVPLKDSVDEDFDPNLDDEVTQVKMIGSTSALPTKRPSVMTLGPVRCRICLEESQNDEGEQLISPCRCRGTVGLLHASCLQEWLATAHTTKCELCGYQYILKRSRTARIHKATAARGRRHTTAIGLWLRSKVFQRHLATDVVCSILLIGACSCVAYFCWRGANDVGKKNEWAWQVVILWCLLLTACSIVLLWLIYVGHHHFKAYRRAREMRRVQEERLRKEEEEAEQWRFSVQPRPRGSSSALLVMNDGRIGNLRSTMKAAGSTRAHLDTVLETTEISSTNLDLTTSPAPCGTLITPPRSSRLDTANPDISVNEDDIIL